ncbi:MAG: ABC transporter ATP-binding protein [Candidatus Caldarchaeum sp.]|nr:ABC transporter ATP-binding protein [Candidatus Caldarchaeum sp.]MCX8200794.1 ABC transporter ATP-binding protein [Candidatus Caldarchaeum sp.]MDW8434675.1 ABC transporter ATP-binding protein [Candidatus Caldarchaeum sp.]
MLDVRNLRLYYGMGGTVVKAVDGVEFRVADGETIGLVGESGSGKTSTGLALMRLLPNNVVHFSGHAFIDGVDLLAMDYRKFVAEFRWKVVSMVFQGAMNSFNPVLKVGEQVAEPLLVKTDADRKEAVNLVKKMFRQVGLPEEVAERYPHELSGGMKQRAMIAMALILNPRLIILDEPTSALDVSIQTQVINLLKKLKKELQLSMIFITHDLALVSDIADSIAVMYAGEVVEFGVSDDLLTNPAHPYTQKLLKSIPRLKGSKTLEYIPGQPPNLSNPPTGCRFHPRCPRVFDKCSLETPPSIAVGNGVVKCWLYGGEKEG